MIIFCTSLEPVNYFNNFYPKIKMIGLGNYLFQKPWININKGKNISHKFHSYADLTAQYFVWKNFLQKYNKNDWIGFAQYRRFWIKKIINKEYPIDKLEDLILTKPDCTWKNYEAVIPSPFFFRNRIIKITKNFLLLKFLKDLNSIKYKVSVLTQFEQSLGYGGKDIIVDIIKMLPVEHQIGFKNFLNDRNYLSAHGMYISKKEIIENYSNILFNWFLKCENILNKTNDLPLIKNKRIFQYINERFLDYWMSSNLKVIRWPVAMYNVEKKQIIPIGVNI